MSILKAAIDSLKLDEFLKDKIDRYNDYVNSNKYYTDLMRDSFFVFLSIKDVYGNNVEVVKDKGELLNDSLVKVSVDVKFYDVLDLAKNFYNDVLYLVDGLKGVSEDKLKIVNTLLLSQAKVLVANNSKFSKFYNITEFVEDFSADTLYVTINPNYRAGKYLYSLHYNPVYLFSVSYISYLVDKSRGLDISIDFLYKYYYYYLLHEFSHIKNNHLRLFSNNFIYNNFDIKTLNIFWDAQIYVDIGDEGEHVPFVQNLIGITDFFIYKVDSLDTFLDLYNSTLSKKTDYLVSVLMTRLNIKLDKKVSEEFLKFFEWFLKNLVNVFGVEKGSGRYIYLNFRKLMGVFSSVEVIVLESFMRFITNSSLMDNILDVDSGKNTEDGVDEDQDLKFDKSFDKKYFYFSVGSTVYFSQFRYDDLEVQIKEGRVGSEYKYYIAYGLPVLVTGNFSDIEAKVKISDVEWVDEIDLSIYLEFYENVDKVKDSFNKAFKDVGDVEFKGILSTHEFYFPGEFSDVDGRYKVFYRVRECNYDKNRIDLGGVDKVYYLCEMEFLDDYLGHGDLNEIKFLAEDESSGNKFELGVRSLLKHIFELKSYNVNILFIIYYILLFVNKAFNNGRGKVSLDRGRYITVILKRFLSIANSFDDKSSSEGLRSFKDKFSFSLDVSRSHLIFSCKDVYLYCLGKEGMDKFLDEIVERSLGSIESSGFYNNVNSFYFKKVKGGVVTVRYLGSMAKVLDVELLDSEELYKRVNTVVKEISKILNEIVGDWRDYLKSNLANIIKSGGYSDEKSKSLFDTGVAEFYKFVGVVEVLYSIMFSGMIRDRAEGFLFCKLSDESLNELKTKITYANDVFFDNCVLNCNPEAVDVSKFYAFKEGDLVVSRSLGKVGVVVKRNNVDGENYYEISF